MKKSILLACTVFIACLGGCKNNLQQIEPETIKAYDIDPKSDEIKTRATYQELSKEYDYKDVGVRPSGMPDTLLESVPKGLPIKDIIPKELRKTELPQYRSGRLKVYTVDGEWLRNQNLPMAPENSGLSSKYSIDFGGGGHNKVFPLMIPPNEIWIDRKFGVIDGKSYILHELREYRAMKDGASFNTAHDGYANPLEVEARNNVDELDTMLKQELSRFSPKKLKPQKEKFEEEYEPIVKEKSFIPKRVKQNTQSMGEPTYLGHKILSPNLGGVSL